MMLHETLKKIADEQGLEKLFKKNLANYVSDYSNDAFEPLELKKILKLVIDNNCVYDLKACDEESLGTTISTFTTKLFYDNFPKYTQDDISYVLTSVAYGLGRPVSFKGTGRRVSIPKAKSGNKTSKKVKGEKDMIDWFGPTPKDKDHLYFKGVRIYGRAQSFVEKMIADGYVPNHEESSEQNYVLEGSYANIPSKLMVQISPKTHQTSRVMVIFDEKTYKNWPALKALYFNLKDKLTKKYGKPASSTEAFFPPYKDGCGKEIKLLDENKGAYQSKYDTDGGEIRLVIMSEARVIIAFMDTQGCIELQREFEEASQNDM